MAPFAKREIKKSFIKLLNEEPVSQITVKEIVEDCGVNRNSFYYHFQDISSLLREVIQEMTDHIIENIPENSSIEDQIGSVLESFGENEKALYNIYLSSDRQLYERQLMGLCEYVTRSYLNTRDYAEHVSDQDREYVVSFLKSLMYGQMIEWLSSGMSYSLVDYSRELCRMFAGTLTAACERRRID